MDCLAGLQRASLPELDEHFLLAQRLEPVKPVACLLQAVPCLFFWSKRDRSPSSVRASYIRPGLKTKDAEVKTPLGSLNLALSIESLVPSLAALENVLKELCGFPIELAHSFHLKRPVSLTKFIQLKGGVDQHSMHNDILFWVRHEIELVREKRGLLI